jgi:hypothetical protein
LGSRVLRGAPEHKAPGVIKVLKALSVHKELREPKDF